MYLEKEVNIEKTTLIYWRGAGRLLHTIMVILWQWLKLTNYFTRTGTFKTNIEYKSQMKIRIKWVSGYTTLMYRYIPVDKIKQKNKGLDNTTTICKIRYYQMFPCSSQEGHISFLCLSGLNITAVPSLCYSNL